MSVTPLFVGMVTFLHMQHNNIITLIIETPFQSSFANANVLIVLGELMGGDNNDGSVKCTAIPLIDSAIVLAQFTMSGATYAGDALTKKGVGRKPLFLAGLLTLPIRCALIIFWKDAGDSWLLSTQILDGLGGGFFGLLHPYLVNDIAFGSGRFNVLSKLPTYRSRWVLLLSFVVKFLMPIISP